MAIKLPKKIQFLLQINTLYSYIFHRFLVKIRSVFKLPPLYPYEKEYHFDAETKKILDQLQQAIPADERGDNPAFNKNWKNIAEREEKARRVSAIIKRTTGDIRLEGDGASLSSIREVGYARFKNKKMNVDIVDKIIGYLDQQKVYPSHVAHFTLEKPQEKEAVRKKSPFGSYDVETILKAPFMAQILSDNQVVGTITDYFGCLPTIASVNLFWAFTSNDGKSRGPQRFHRDIDDHKTCTMFINLTDTKEDEGAHCYIQKTHTLETLKQVFNERKNDDLPEALNPWQRRVAPEDFFSLPLNGYSFDNLYNHFFQEHVVNLCGERGTVLVTDNYGIHRGMPSRQHDRLILWVSYALTATHTQSAEVKLIKRAPYSALKDIENNKTNRYVLRNVVDFGS